jgi:hypothetical protein
MLATADAALSARMSEFQAGLVELVLAKDEALRASIDTPPGT